MLWIGTVVWFIVNVHSVVSIVQEVWDRYAFVIVSDLP